MLGHVAVLLRDCGRRRVYLSPWVSSSIETSCVYNNYQTLESPRDLKNPHTHFSSGTFIPLETEQLDWFSVDFIAR